MAQQAQLQLWIFMLRRSLALYATCMTLLMQVNILSWGTDSNSLAQTKIKLHQLDSQIQQLKLTLSQAHNKRKVFTQKLSHTEKQISASVHQLHLIQEDLAVKQHAIDDLEHKLQISNTKLALQQELLAEHIRTRYKMGEYQPLKWLLMQDEPYTISRLFTFYKYLVKTRQEIIAQIIITKDAINVTQQDLKSEIETKQSLQTKIKLQQEQLQQYKDYHTALLAALNKEILAKQHDLAEYEHNKANLAKLLLALVAQSHVTEGSFAKMQHKLARPVLTRAQAFQRLHQGVTFFAAEGAAVKAVYAGKVVFSDWLNGYGLLLIIDHGQGFMTLYAHNQALFKSRGENVRSGEQIATVGHSGGLQRDGLYFEIRHAGKAIAPLDWLS